MDAIRRILTDFEDAFPDPAPETATPLPVDQPEPEVQVEEPTLTPVATVEAKVASAKFTTVPNVERLSAVARVMESGMNTSDTARAPSSKNLEPGTSSKSSAPREKRGWKIPSIPRPSLSLPKFTLPAISVPKVTLPAMPGLARSKISLPKLSLPKPGGVTLPKLSLPGRKQSGDHAPELSAKTPGRAAKQTNRMPQLREATARTAPMMSREGVLAMRYHITPLRVAMAGLVVAMFLWPAVAILLLVLAIFVMAAPFLILGADGVWEKVAQLVNWYCARHPARKDAVYDGLDALALRWDAVLDRLPEDLVEGLYMPDFANMEEVQDHHDKVVSDRLNKMQNQA